MVRKSAFDPMDTLTRSLFHRGPIIKPRWIKEWIPQDLVSTGGKCFVLKWVNEVALKAMKEKSKDPETMNPEPEPTTEVLFLCSYEGCGKTFFDAVTLRKHSQIHGEKQYVCHYENCGKKFMESSRLKRHFLIHTGERDFVCPHEGCGKAFALQFNLRSHMRTHSQENYHICPYPECGKRYAQECKLKNHVTSHHVKSGVDAAKYAPPPTRPSGPAFVDRPYICPYEGCTKDYIHGYKLNLHLRREHPGHFPDENKMDDGSGRDAYAGKRVNGNKIQKREIPKPELKLPPSKTPKRESSAAADLTVVKRDWACKQERYDEEEEEEDSEETEQEGDNLTRDRWRTGNSNNEDGEDDEETEYED